MSSFSVAEDSQCGTPGLSYIEATTASSRCICRAAIESVADYQMLAADFQLLIASFGLVSVPCWDVKQNKTLVCVLCPIGVLFVCCVRFVCFL